MRQPPLGSLNPERRHLNTRYSVRDVDVILGWWRQGYTREQIAARLNVSPTEIEAIIIEATRR